MAARHPAVHIAIVVIALGLAVGLVAWRLDQDPWVRAAAHVRERSTPGELVVITPSFQHREVRAFEGLPVIAADSLSPSDARRFPGVWAVSSAPLPPALSRLDQTLGAPVRTELGPLVVHHWSPR